MEDKNLPIEIYARILGYKQYELKDHLGNSRAEFEFPSTSNSNTIIHVPRNDNATSLNIVLSNQDSRTAPSLRLSNTNDLKKWGVLINAEIMSDYDQVTDILKEEITDTETSVSKAKTYEKIGTAKSRINKSIYKKTIQIFIDE